MKPVPKRARLRPSMPILRRRFPFIPVRMRDSFSCGSDTGNDAISDSSSCRPLKSPCALAALCAIWVVSRGPSRKTLHGLARVTSMSKHRGEKHNGQKTDDTREAGLRDSVNQHEGEKCRNHRSRPVVMIGVSTQQALEKAHYQRRPKNHNTNQAEVQSGLTQRIVSLACPRENTEEHPTRGFI